MKTKDSLREYMEVRVVKLLTPNRDYSGTPSVSRAPVIGDRGVVCHACAGGEEFSVEMVDGAGRTVWLADFSPEEIEPFGPAELTDVV